MLIDSQAAIPSNKTPILSYADPTRGVPTLLSDGTPTITYYYLVLLIAANEFNLSSANPIPNILRHGDTKLL